MSSSSDYGLEKLQLNPTKHCVIDPMESCGFPSSVIVFNMVDIKQACVHRFRDRRSVHTSFSRQKSVCK